MARRELILKDQDGNFITFGGFSPEYPDARHFNHLSGARTVAKDLINAGKATEIGIFENYGMEDESCIDSIFLA